MSVTVMVLAELFEMSLLWTASTVVGLADPTTKKFGITKKTDIDLVQGAWTSSTIQCQLK
jgi:hypothetical protein